MAENQSGITREAPPWLPFATFENSLIKLKQVVPPVIDRSLWDTQSGGNQKLLMAAYKFLGLVDDVGKPQRILHDIVEKEGEAQMAAYRQITEKCYARVIALPIDRATMQQVEVEFNNSYGIEGNTRRKAVSFFQKLAEKSGVKLSPHLKKTRTRKIGNGRRNRQAVQSRQNLVEEPPKSETPVLGSGFSRSLTLRTGGTLALSMTVNLFDLDEDDRHFVFEMIDKMKNYEKTGDESEK